MADDQYVQQMMDNLMAALSEMRDEIRALQKNSVKDEQIRKLNERIAALENASGIESADYQQTPAPSQSQQTEEQIPEQTGPPEESPAKEAGEIHEPPASESSGPFEQPVEQPEESIEEHPDEMLTAEETEETIAEAPQIEMPSPPEVPPPPDIPEAPEVPPPSVAEGPHPQEEEEAPPPEATEAEEPPLPDASSEEAQEAPADELPEETPEEDTGPGGEGPEGPPELPEEDSGTPAEIPDGPEEPPELPEPIEPPIEEKPPEPEAPSPPSAPQQQPARPISYESVRKRTEPSRTPPPPPRPAKKQWDWGEIESKLAIWGTRIGAFLVVAGLGYLLSIGFSKLGVAGKVAVVYAACVAMGGTGWFFEKKEQYSTWGKIMIAAGWAGLYITTFMIHYLEQARLITDPTLDVFMLMVIAFGMIAHSFKYRSESLTTLTYFIAFMTIALSIRLEANTLFSLVGTSVLAGSMLFILHRMQWMWLSFFSMVACYGTHSLWIRLEPLFPQLREAGTPMFKLGVVMVVLYWMIFNVATFITRPSGKKSDTLALWIMALNYVLFVAVFRYHVGSEHPEWRWYFTGVVALAYVGITYVAHLLQRKDLYTLSLVIAVLSTTMTIYFRLGGNWVAVGWLLQAEALYMAGVLTDEKRFRYIGLANFALVLGWLFAKDFMTLDRIELWGLSFYKWNLSFATTALVFYINSKLKNILGDRVKSDSPYNPAFSYVGSVLVLAIMARWFGMEDLLDVAVVGALLGLALMEVGVRSRDFHFRVQGLFFSFLAVIAAILPLVAVDNWYYSQDFYYRVASEALVIFCAYVAFARFQRLMAKSEEAKAMEVSAALFSAGAALISVILLYREIGPLAPFLVSFGWITLGIVLIETGVALRNPFFRVQGYIVAGLALFWSLFSFMTRGEFSSHPVINIAGMALVVGGFFYLFARLLGAGSGSAFSDIERKEALPGWGPALTVLFSAAGSLILVLLLRQELLGVNPFLIAVAWLVAAVALFEVGAAIKNPPLRLQAFIIAGATFVAAIWYNLTLGVMEAPLSERFIETGATALVVLGFFYLFARLISSGASLSEVERKGPLPGSGPLLSIVFSAAGSFILVLLLRQEIAVVNPFFIAVAWLAAAVALFEVGAAIKNPPLRVQAFIIVGATFLAAIWYNLGAGSTTGTGGIGAINIAGTAAVVAGFFYLFARLITGGTKFTDFEKKEALPGWGPLPGIVLSAAGSFILVLLLRQELRLVNPFLIAVSWLVTALALFEVGAAIKNQPLRWQAFIIAGAGALAALYYNLRAGDMVGPFTMRLLTVSFIVAAVYYICERVFHRGPADDFLPDRTAAEVLSWCASFLLMLLIGLEVWARWPAWVPVAWLVPTAVFYALGIRRGSNNFIAQGLTATATVFLWTLIVNVFTVGVGDATAQVEAHRIITTAPIIVVFYTMFGLAMAKAGRLAGSDEDRQAALSYARDAFSYFGSVLLVSLVTVELNQVSPVLTTVVWAGLAALFFETGALVKGRAFKTQAHLLVAAAFIRSLVVLVPEAHGEFYFLSGRAAGMLAVAAALYHQYLRTLRSSETAEFKVGEDAVGKVMSWLSLVTLFVLLAMEVPRAYVPAAWGGIMVAALCLSLVLRDRQLLIQSVLLTIPVAVGTLVVAFPEHGSMEGRLGTGLAVAALFAGRTLWQFAATRATEAPAHPGGEKSPLAHGSRHFFALPAAALLAVYIPVEFRGELIKYMTIAWALEGLLLTVMGFALKDRVLRFAGIGVLAGCVGKVFWDLLVSDIERFYKVIALIGLGAILIFIGFIYSRFSEQIRKILID